MEHSRDDQIRKLVQTSSAELLRIAKETESKNQKWIRMGEKDDVVIYSRYEEDVPINCLKGVGIIEADPKTIFEVIWDVEKMKEWDRMSEEIRIVREIDKQTAIVYMAMKGKFPVAPRDFCLAAGFRILPDGTYVQSSRSIEDPDVPSVSGKVRAELLTSGFVIKPILRTNPPYVASLVTYVVQFDPKGWIPTFIANRVGEYQPLRIAKIRSFIPSQGIPSVHNGKLEEEEEIPLLDRRQRVHDNSDDTDEEFQDASSDFTISETSSTSDLRSYIGVLQRQIMQLQQMVEQTQSQMRIIETKKSLPFSTSSEMVSKLNALEQNQNQQQSYLETRDERWKTQLSNFDRRLVRLEKVTTRIQTPTGKRFLLFFFLVLWPFVSLRLWNLWKQWMGSLPTRGQRSATVVSLLTGLWAARRLFLRSK